MSGPGMSWPSYLVLAPQENLNSNAAAMVVGNIIMVVDFCGFKYVKMVYLRGCLAGTFSRLDAGHHLV